MARILVQVQDIQPTSSETPGNYILKLKEQEGNRTLRIVIGLYDSQIIAFELQKLKSLRPLAHDLFKIILETFDIKMKHTEIVSMDKDEGVFYANIKLNDKTIDCRPSDGIIMALKFNTPIYVQEKVFQIAGEEGPIQSFSQSDLTTDILIRQKKEQLEMATEQENYELAAKLKKEIEELIKKHSTNN